MCTQVTVSAKRVLVAYLLLQLTMCIYLQSGDRCDGRMTNQTSDQELPDWHWLKYTLLYNTRKLKLHSWCWWLWSLTVLVTLAEAVKTESSLTRGAGPDAGLFFLASPFSPPTLTSKLRPPFIWVFSLQIVLSPLPLFLLLGWVMLRWDYSSGCSRYLTESLSWFFFSGLNAPCLKAKAVLPTLNQRWPSAACS